MLKYGLGCVNIVLCAYKHCLLLLSGMPQGNNVSTTECCRPNLSVYEVYEISCLKYDYVFIFLCENQHCIPNVDRLDKSAMQIRCVKQHWRQ